jgi:hypothetical protein
MISACDKNAFIPLSGISASGRLFIGSGNMLFILISLFIVIA